MTLAVSLPVLLLAARERIRRSSYMKKMDKVRVGKGGIVESKDPKGGGVT